MSCENCGMIQQNVLGYCGNFEKSLQYVSPSHGGWGVIRVALLVPESYLLFVCPFACGRHGALGATELGIKDRLSYLYIDEEDIVSGHYEDLIPDAVDELFSTIEKMPKVLFIFGACIDDLLGTDHVSLNKILSEKYPQVEFRTCHMNPFAMDTPNPPGVTLMQSMYDLLIPNGKNEKQINLIGNNAAIPESNDLINLLKQRGYKTIQLENCKTFDEFRQMEKSTLNLLLRPVARKACVMLEEKLSTPFMESFVSYRITEIENFYKALSEKLNEEPFDFTELKSKCLKKIEETKNLLNDFPIAVDYQAVLRPFNLARALSEYGFNVRLIVTNEVLGIEKKDVAWVSENLMDIQVVNAMHPDMTKFLMKGTQVLCIGFDSGYMTESKHVVSVLEDEKMFGFEGIVSLMEKIQIAFKTTSDVYSQISEAKLVI